MAKPARPSDEPIEKTIVTERFVSVRRRGLGSGPVCTARLTNRVLTVGVPFTRYRLAIPLPDITRVVVDDGASMIRLHIWYLNDTDGGGVRLLVKNPRKWVGALREAGVDVAGDAEAPDRWNRLMGLCCNILGLAAAAAVVILVVLASTR